MSPHNLFDISGKTAVVTGGCGVLCSAIGEFLAENGANIVLLDLDTDRGEECARIISEHQPGTASALYGNVLEPDTLTAAANTVIQQYGSIDILLNCAGGNHPQATTSPDVSFFDLSPEAAQWTFNLNFLGTLLPSQAFGRHMVAQGSGVIINVSSMNAFRPLTRIPAYSGAKAAVSNFTQWLAVHMAQEYTPDIRVNAIAPGFFLTAQNRFLLIDEATGGATPRGQQIIDHTPAGRYGVPTDLLGTVLWLASPASQFVTGIVVPIDGGFSAYSGV